MLPAAAQIHLSSSRPTRSTRITDGRSKITILILWFTLLILLPSKALHAAFTASVSGDRLSVHAVNIPTAEILQFVANKADLKVTFYGTAETKTNVRFQNLLLEDGLKRILANSNCAFYYEKRKSNYGGEEIYLKEVVVVSERGGTNARTFMPEKAPAPDPPGEKEPLIAGEQEMPSTPEPESSKKKKMPIIVADGRFVKADRALVTDLKTAGSIGAAGAEVVELPFGMAGGLKTPPPGSGEERLKGVKLTGIPGRSVLHILGLKEGDIIQDIDGHQTSSPEQVEQLLSEALQTPGKDVIRIEVTNEEENKIEPIYVELQK